MDRISLLLIANKVVSDQKNAISKRKLKVISDQKNAITYKKERSEFCECPENRYANVWKPVGLLPFTDLYEISICGVVRSRSTQEILKPVSHAVYLKYNKQDYLYKIESLIAHTFLKMDKQSPLRIYVKDKKLSRCIHNINVFKGTYYDIDSYAFNVVKQYSSTGEYIQTFNNVYEAYDTLPGMTRSKFTLFLATTLAGREIRGFIYKMILN